MVSASKTAFGCGGFVVRASREVVAALDFFALFPVLQYILNES